MTTMTTELTILGWALVLALVQIMLAARVRAAETGIAYNLGPRDTPAPPPGPMAGRLTRAQDNLLETLPLFAAAVLIAHVTGREGDLTLWGSYAYIIGRVLFVPLYAFGVPLARSVAWGVSLTGIVMILVAILR